MMLATPTNRPYAVNVIQHMKKNGVEIEKYPTRNNIKYIQSSSLPARFLRGLQYVDGKEVKDEDKVEYIQEPNIYSSIFHSKENDTIVNKKNETAEKSISNDLKVVDKPLGTTRLFNVRTERKMRIYGKDVLDFIKDKHMLDAIFLNQLEEYKIKGLVKYCEEKIDKKNERQIKI